MISYASDPNYALVQLFLSKDTPVVFEVYVRHAGDKRAAKLVCTCPGYGARRRCKHADFVFSKFNTDNGEYPILADLARLDEEEIREWVKDQRAFREHVISTTPIAVI